MSCLYPPLSCDKVKFLFVFFVPKWNNLSEEAVQFEGFVDSVKTVLLFWQRTTYNSINVPSHNITIKLGFKDYQT